MGHSSVQDVVVIGEGITGLSTLLHLKALGIDRIVCAADPGLTPVSVISPGLLLGGQVDNFTRFSHRHGLAVAAEVWRFGDRAFDELYAWCLSHGIQAKRGYRVRLIGDAAEETEARKAVNELRTQGFESAAIHDGREALAGFGPDVSAVQVDGDRAAVVDPRELMSRLRAAAGCVPIGPVRSINAPKSKAGRLSLKLENGDSLTTELVVVAAHTGIGRLVPDLAEAVVPYADQYMSMLGSTGPGVPVAGTVWTALHANLWGGLAPDGRCVAGGARFRRRGEGVEATESAYEPAVAAHLAGFVRKTFPKGGWSEGPGHAFRDIRVCDELPLVGPMFGQSRILLATGFMGSGLAAGYLAGRCLAQLIVNGHSDILPRCLWPERLRSLES